MLCAIGLHQPKTPANVGSVLRAAHAYGAQMVATTGRRYHRTGTDTSRAFAHIPLVETTDLLKVIPFNAVPVAVELRDDARSLFSYTHPRSAYYIFGPEDGSVPVEIVSQCRDVVYIPTKYCMNLAATVNVVLYDRACKEAQRVSLFQQRQ
jgi:tRNA(Leu) C34 or U34 (ribose-2'-O)-methylase TrmL